MADWNNLDWKPWEEVLENRVDLPKRPGAYAVRCAPRDRPKVIGRAFRRDRMGILFFGSTTMCPLGLKARLTTLCRALRGLKSPHAEARRYCEVDYHQHGFPLDSLQIGWRQCQSAEQAKAQELCWFDKYFNEFGELPPLNRKRG